MYLESAAQAEDTVVGLLGVEALESGVDDIVLLGEQVIGPVRQSVSSGPSTTEMLPFCPRRIQLHPTHALNSLSKLVSTVRAGCSVPQTELPVAGGVGVPVGEGLHPALEPWALHDGGGERRRGHVCGIGRVRAGGRGAACGDGGVQSSKFASDEPVSRISNSELAAQFARTQIGLASTVPTRMPGLLLIAAA